MLQGYQPWMVKEGFLPKKAMGPEVMLQLRLSGPKKCGKVKASVWGRRLYITIHGFLLGIVS